MRCELSWRVANNTLENLAAVNRNGVGRFDADSDGVASAQNGDCDVVAYGD